MTVIQFVIGIHRIVSKGKVVGSVGNRRTNRDNPNYSIVKLVLNSKKSPEDDQLKLERKTRNNNNNNKNNDNMSKKMTHINSYEILTYTRITESRPVDQTL